MHCIALSGVLKRPVSEINESWSTKGEPLWLGHDDLLLLLSFATGHPATFAVSAQQSRMRCWRLVAPGRSAAARRSISMSHR